MSASILSVNVGSVRTVRRGEEDVATAIFKEPVDGRVAVRGVNIAGDDQGDRSVHGGPVRAIYAYAAEDYAWWEGELGRKLAPGTFGENLTTQGFDVNEALIGERWSIGTTVLQITIPRVPCFKLAMRMDDPTFVKRFAAALRPGPYLTIVHEGELGQGDAIEVIHRPSHRITIAEMAKIYLFERDRLRELLVPELPESLVEWVQGQDA